MSNFMDYLNATGLVNKIKTMLDKKQFTIQFSTMPTASADYEGQIVQFIGTTDNNYTNGYWYKCEEITPSTTPKTYHWVKITHEVDNDTLHEDANGIMSVDSKYKKIWEGTHAEWDLLSTAEKIAYDVAHFNDDAPTAEIVGYQKKTLDTPLTIDGTQQTTVEGALGGLNTKKINSSAIANNLTTTTSGKVLDARQGKVLDGKITDLSDDFTKNTYSSTTNLLTQVGSTVVASHDGWLYVAGGTNGGVVYVDDVNGDRVGACGGVNAHVIMPIKKGFRMTIYSYSLPQVANFFD